MKVSKIGKLIFILLSNPQVLIGRKDYIFIVSHLRSYSSLLCHILGSHSKIYGYAEMHQSYNWWPDFVSLKYKACLVNNNRLDGSFVLDKMLHKHCHISDRIINKKNIHLIFMLRNPEDTIKSIINMGKNIVEKEWLTDSGKVLDYYEKRLKQISIYAQKTSRRAVFIDAERIIDNTESVLDFLSDWLKLEHKLKPEYSTFRYTGSP